MLKEGAAPAAPPTTLPVEELVLDEEEPAAEVGAGKTLERTPEPGTVELLDEGERAADEAVVDGASATPCVVDEEAFAVAGSTETDVSAMSASEVLGSEASVALFFA